MPRTTETPYTCPNCHGNQTYFRSTSQTMTCKKCGHIWSRGEKVITVETSLFGDPVEERQPIAKTKEEILKELQEGVPEKKEHTDEELETMEFSPEKPKRKKKGD